MPNSLNPEQPRLEKRPEPTQSLQLKRNHAPVQHYSAAGDVDEGSAPAGVPLKHRLWVIWRNLPAIVGFVAIATYSTAVISKRITPIYDATATIDVDRRAPTTIVGQDNSPTASPIDTEQFLNTQVRLIQSDSVLKPVVDSFHMTRVPGTVGFENLKISRPVNSYLILINYRSTNPKRAAEFANAVANSYILQFHNIRFRASVSLSDFMTRQIEELRAKMERSSQALEAFGQNMGMIGSEDTNGIVSARLLQLNTEYTAAQGERVKKEAAVQSLKSGSLEDFDVSAQADSLRHLEDRLTDAQEKFSDAERQYGDRHPKYLEAQDKVKSLNAELDQAKGRVTRRVESEYRQAMNRESILKQQVTDTKAEFDRLNSRAGRYQDLKREAEADRKLYEELSNRIKESGINAGFQDSSIRLADVAVSSPLPIYPNITRNIELAFLLSLVIAIGAALTADSMNPTLRSTDDVIRNLNVDVIGILPKVRKWEGGWLTGPNTEPAKLPAAGGGNASKAAMQLNSYEDGIRSLRNSILHGAFGQTIQSVMVTSASPSEGKTTAAVHLAIAHAHQKRKTLLIDCDLRRPAVRTVLNLPNSIGLSYALADESGWRQQLAKETYTRNLDVLLAGTASRRHADLIGHYLPQIIREAAGEYDLIVIDAPPVLGFPEPLQLATAVDAVVMVVLAGKTDHRAVASALDSLQRLRANTIGIVLNELKRTTAMDTYAYGRHGQYYQA